MVSNGRAQFAVLANQFLSAKPFIAVNDQDGDAAERRQYRCESGVLEMRRHCPGAPSKVTDSRIFGALSRDDRAPGGSWDDWHSPIIPLSKGTSIYSSSIQQTVSKKRLAVLRLCSFRPTDS
jgi:hypothetical protein